MKFDTFVVLACLSCSVLGVWLYTGGFFLTRYQVEDQSPCGLPPSSSSSSSTSMSSDCWMPSTFKRLIIVVVDALRFDFVSDVDVEKEKTDDDNIGGGGRCHYRNRMKKIKALVDEQPDNTLLFKFWADAPTTTMQRLKALTTGGLPTFFELRLNFDSPAVDEDNLIGQLERCGRRLMFMGDDTWVQLFPDAFDTAYPFPSMNVKDLHSVDLGVMRHVMPALRNADAPRYDVIVAHFLGVDHVGHRFGPDHPAMAAKLEQIDDAIGDVVRHMDNESLLVVLGDHGMTSDGNHGGASDLETQSALLFYSKAGLISSPFPFAVGDESRHPRHRQVDQIDLVSTLSLLVGVPIPFGNVGRVIPELFLGYRVPADGAFLRNDDDDNDDRWSSLLLGGNDESDQRERLARTARALQLNARQVRNYMVAYARTSAEFSSSMRELDDAYERAEQRHASAQTVADYRRAVADFHSFLADVASMCRLQWTAFDLPAMRCGIAALLAASMLMIWLLRDAPATTLPVGGAVVALFLHGYGLFSNSYIEREEQVVHYLVVTMLGVIGYDAHRRRSLPWRDVALLAVAMRVMSALSMSGGGRHEAADRQWSLAFELLALLGLVALAMRAFRGHRDRVAASCSRVHRCVVFALVPLCASLVASFWLAQRRCGGADDGEQRACATGTLAAAALLWLPRAVYALSGVGVLASALVASRQRAVHASLALAASASMTLAMLLGPSSPLPMLCACVQAALLSRVVARARPPASSIGVLWALCTVQYFFASGHQFSFSTLQLECSFIGFDQFHFGVAGALLALNTFAAPVLAVALMPAVLSASGIVDARQRARFLLAFVLTFTIGAALTATFVYIARRHLMVWRVFAPKYIFDGALMLVVDALALFISPLIVSS
jgi:GPI ethanolamine phosphate transferase 3 subunit O